jgi:hypothetical protein
MVDGPPETYSTQRYLTAKRTVDDRALNERVFRDAVSFLSDRDPPARVMEVAAGIGTMLERLLDRDALPGDVTYTMLDIDPASIAAAEQRLPDHARSLGYTVETRDDPHLDGQFRESAPSFALTLSRSDRQVRVRAGTADVFPFAARTDRTWDLLVAAAFLDIVPGGDRLETLFDLVPGGGYYAPIVFDGATRFVPAVDRPFDRRLERRWHAGMRTGEDPNDPRAGSRLPVWVERTGGTLDAVGGSSWAVRPAHGPAESGYPGDEAYFLYHVLHFVERSLVDDTRLNVDRVREWVTNRQEQVRDASLCYIAHNLDAFGRVDTH